MSVRLHTEADDRSVGTLISEATKDLGALVRKEVELAKLELREELGVAVESGKYFGIGAFCGYLSVVLLSFAAAWGLAEVIAAGWAFLVVALIYAAVGIFAVLRGRDRVRVLHPVPEQTVETLKEDVQWLKARRKNS
jgi:hypothetical protein